MAIDFANSRTLAWPNWCPDWYPYTPVYPFFYCYYPFSGRSRGGTERYRYLFLLRLVVPHSPAAGEPGGGR